MSRITLLSVKHDLELTSQVDSARDAQNTERESAVVFWKLSFLWNITHRYS